MVCLWPYTEWFVYGQTCTVLRLPLFPTLCPTQPIGLECSRTWKETADQTHQRDGDAPSENCSKKGQDQVLLL